jgi:D-alanyl-D-alanine carboxypeptidase
VSVPAPPACRYGSKPAAVTAYGRWKTTLLDTTFRLPASYEPRDLVSVASAGFDGGFLVRHLVVRDLVGLREAAEAAGHPIEIVAAYRSYEYQADLFQRRMQRLGVAEAQRKTARPGHSEHQLGTVLDFKRAGAPTTTQAFGGTPTGKWLTANAASFGFVLSYPEGEDSITCYGYEPWHFRYFGRKTAATIAASGLTTREYLWAHRPERAASPSPSPDASTPSASGAAPTTGP